MSAGHSFEGGAVSIRRALSLLLGLGTLLGCSLFTLDLKRDELHQLAEREKYTIYFSGDSTPAPKFANKLGKVDGRICQGNLIESMTEFQALAAMWSSAKAKGATAVVEASCGTSSFWLPTGGSYCFPGYYCTGEAVK